MTDLTPSQTDVQKLIAEWEQLMTDFPFAWRVCKEATTPDQHHEKCSWRTSSMLCDCAADKAFIYTVETFRKYTQPIAAYIRQLELEHEIMRNFIRVEASSGNKEAQAHLDSLTLRPKAPALQKVAWSSSIPPR